MRIRHVASGRLLVVDPSKRAFSVKQSATFGAAMDRSMSGALLDDDDKDSAGIGRTKSGTGANGGGISENWYETSLQEKDITTFDGMNDGTVFYIQVSSDTISPPTPR